MANSLIGLSIVERMQSLCIEIAQLDESEAIEVINATKQALHEVSPLKSEPVDCVIWVKSEEVHANLYNPNSVAPPEMRLLELSIKEDGYTQPIVTFPENGSFEVVDGFHRHRVGRESKIVNKRVKGYLPITAIRSDRQEYGDRVASTIRHNKARGKHGIQKMSELIVDLKRRNHSNKWIAEELGLDPDEILRLAQISGLAEMFADREFSEAWEVVERNEND